MKFEQVIDLLLEEGSEVYRFQSATIRTDPSLQRGSRGSELDAETGNKGIERRN